MGGDFQGNDLRPEESCLFCSLRAQNTLAHALNRVEQRLDRLENASAGHYSIVERLFSGLFGDELFQVGKAGVYISF